jgi:hypothetical protein
MKYSKYFKGVLHNDGLPQLSRTEWARMMNIASIKYAILKLQKVCEMNQNSSEPYRYDLMIQKEQELLKSLTGDNKPEELIRGMIEESLRW